MILARPIPTSGIRADSTFKLHAIPDVSVDRTHVSFPDIFSCAKNDLRVAIFKKLDRLLATEEVLNTPARQRRASPGIDATGVSAYDSKQIRPWQ